LRIIGGFYILYLAWDAYKTTKRTEDISLSDVPQSRQRVTFLKGITMNLLNPNVYIFWATIGVPTILTGWQISPFYGIAFGFGFYITMIPVTMFWIRLMGTVGYLKPSLQTKLSWLIIVLLVIVSITMIVNGLMSWLMLPIS
jgi:threonine/homoserine/homoserine lactone efflux protein